MQINGKEITVASERWSVPYPVADARVVDQSVIVLYDYMTGPRHRQFQNLEAFDFTGRKLWTAEHPTSATQDCYVAFQSIRPLRLSNFAGFECELAPDSGRIIAATFTK